jgi:hypothetical protein
MDAVLTPLQLHNTRNTERFGRRTHFDLRQATPVAD